MLLRTILFWMFWVPSLPFVFGYLLLKRSKHPFFMTGMIRQSVYEKMVLQKNQKL
jgi:hypothetical protein